MERLSQILESEKATSMTVDDWINSGLVNGLKKSQIVKFSKVANMAIKIITEEFKNKNKLRENVDVAILTCIRRFFLRHLFKVKIYRVHKDFKFTKKNLLEFISFMNDCYNLNSFKKYIDNNNVHIEGELGTFLTAVYLSNKNEIYKQKTKII